MMQALVSVVTPAYNEESRIAQCIDSVLSQTHANWEYVIVNNCSSDRTFEIAQQYAQKDPRIRVVNNERLIPAVINFNHALRQISSGSRYCKMVLADDWIFPECLERMVAVAEMHPSIGVVGAYGIQDNYVLWHGLRYGENYLSGREVCRRRLFGGPYVFGSQTSVLFRSDLVRSHNPFFNEANPHGADSEACFELLKESDFGFVFQILTYSLLRGGSLREESREVNAAAADSLREMVNFGPHYLTEQEYRDCVQMILDKYYGMLASALFGGRSAKFWKFHKSRLDADGFGFSYLRLGSALCRKVMQRFRRKPRNPYEWGF